jgi:hypothetical protein
MTQISSIRLSKNARIVRARFVVRIMMEKMYQ